MNLVHDHPDGVIMKICNAIQYYDLLLLTNQFLMARLKSC
jgi:hypothetical protein